MNHTSLVMGNAFIILCFKINFTLMWDIAVLSPLIQFIIKQILFKEFEGCFEGDYFYLILRSFVKIKKQCIFPPLSLYTFYRDIEELYSHYLICRIGVSCQNTKIIYIGQCFSAREIWKFWVIFEALYCLDISWALPFHMLKSFSCKSYLDLVFEDDRTFHVF